MRKVIESMGLSGLKRTVMIGAVGLAAAGCSSEVTRFSQPLFGGSSETPYTGSVTPSPVAGVERQNLHDPSAQSSPSFAGAADAHGAQTVIVAHGDTAYTIARRHGVPPAALMEANGLSDPTAIRPGQQLVIPGVAGATGTWAQDGASPGVAERVAALPQPQPQPQPSAAPSAQEPRREAGGTHRVDHGETVYSIARAYDVSPLEIIRVNNIDSPDRIRVGQRLTIPGASGATQQAAAPTRPQPASSDRAGASQTASETTGQSADRVAQAEAPQRVPASFTTGDDADSGAGTRAGVSDPAPMSASTFRWPVRGRVVSAFGDTSNGSRNDGVKIAVPEGTSVRAAENGVVAYAGDELKGYGNLVLIRHADDWVTAYAHNSEITVRRGDEVTRGQVIAKAGQTGSVSSPQLHFELRKGSQPVDPLRYLAEN